MTAPRRGARRQVNVKIFYSQESGTPPGCDPINLAFPVVSADFDHRLLSLQPFGLLRSANYIVTEQKALDAGLPRCASVANFPAKENLLPGHQSLARGVQFLQFLFP